MGREGDGLALGVIVVFAVGSVLGLAYVLIQNVTCSRTASNESAAIACLRAYLGAQYTFHRTDYYGIGKKVYANPKDGVGFSDLYQIGYPSAPRGEPFKLIDVTFANASAGNPNRKPKAGYCFADLRYADYSVECGLCAVPASYNRSGRNIFIIDITGVVYQKDAAAVYPGLQTGDTVPPLTRYPDAEALTPWTAVGSQ